MHSNDRGVLIAETLQCIHSKQENLFHAFKLITEILYVYQTQTLGGRFSAKFKLSQKAGHNPTTFAV